MTIDRRALRTRAALQKAHLALIRARGYEAITVEDICRTAGVGRSTFYAHFPDKHALRRSSLAHLRDELHAHRAAAHASRDGVRPLSFSLPMLVHARAYLDLYRALSGGRGRAIALGEIRLILADLVRTDLADASIRLAAGDLPREAVVNYLVGAFMSVLTWWLDAGAELPPERVDETFRRLALDGLGRLSH